MGTAVPKSSSGRRTLRGRGTAKPGDPLREKHYDPRLGADEPSQPELLRGGVPSL